MNLNELITTMAILEERGELEKLAEIGLPRRVQRQKPTLFFAGFPGCFTRTARVLDWRYETGRTRSAM